MGRRRVVVQVVVEGLPGSCRGSCRGEAGVPWSGFRLQFELDPVSDSVTATVGGNSWATAEVVTWGGPVREVVA